MTVNRFLFMILLVAGAFVISAVGFANALILNAVWLHIKDAVAVVASNF
jgi:hypothetical protein